MGQRTRHAQEPQEERCCTWWTSLALVFAMALVVLFIELIVVMSRPEPLPSTLFRPNATLFRRIHTPGKNVPCLYDIHATNKFVRARRLPDRLEQLRNATNNTVTKIRELDAPLFPHKTNSTGIVLTCRLGPLCLANLHHLFDNMNITLPVGLSPPFPSSMHMILLFFHDVFWGTELWLKRSQTRNEELLLLERTFHNKPLTIRFFDDFDKQYFGFFGKADKFNRLYHFYLKLQAMVCSQFQRVLLVDDDAFLLQDPRVVIESKLAQQTGTLFWHDMHAIHHDNLIWQVLDVPPREGLAGESGVVFLDKEVAWQALYLAAFMNNKQSIFNRMLWGDKDTFFLACERLGIPYSFVPYPPYSIGYSRWSQIAFLQSDTHGVPFFIHLVSGKRYSSSLFGFEQFETILTYDPDKAHLCGGLIGSLFTVCKEKGGWSRYVSTRAIGNVHKFIGKAYRTASQELNTIPPQ